MAVLVSHVKQIRTNPSRAPQARTILNAHHAHQGPVGNPCLMKAVMQKKTVNVPQGAWEQTGQTNAQRAKKASTSKRGDMERVSSVENRLQLGLEIRNSNQIASATRDIMDRMEEKHARRVPRALLSQMSEVALARCAHRASTLQPPRCLTPPGVKNVAPTRFPLPIVLFALHVQTNRALNPERRI